MTMTLTARRVLIVAGLILFLLLAGVLVLPARAQTFADLHRPTNDRVKESESASDFQQVAKQEFHK
jgi:hypothetical protein